MELDPASLWQDHVYRLLAAFVAPRPVALVSTVSRAGVINLAPFSMVTLLSAGPPLLGVVVHPRRGGMKDTLRNIRDVGDFVVNGVTASMLESAVAASLAFAPEVSEAEALKIETAPSQKVRSPRVARAPVHLECRLSEVFVPAGSTANLVVGRVEWIHAADGIVRDGEPVPEAFLPAGHLASLRDGYAFMEACNILRVRTPSNPSDPSDANAQGSGSHAR